MHRINMHAKLVSAVVPFAAPDFAAAAVLEVDQQASSPTSVA
jgi:hypothetical protein